ncbi:MAG: hypothetical protein K2O10_05090 [Muribaculaceae bacterium]|nr:hypothetical protein [Muribaculaceae bacterium]
MTQKNRIRASYIPLATVSATAALATSCRTRRSIVRESVSTSDSTAPTHITPTDSTARQPLNNVTLHFDTLEISIAKTTREGCQTISLRGVNASARNRTSTATRHHMVTTAIDSAATSAHTAIAVAERSSASPPAAPWWLWLPFIAAVGAMALSVIKRAK